MVLYCVPPCDSCYIPMTSNGSLFLSFFPAPVVDGDPTKPKRTSEGNKKTKKKWTDRSLHAWWKVTQHIWWLSKWQWYDMFDLVCVLIIIIICCCCFFFLQFTTLLKVTNIHAGSIHNLGIWHWSISWLVRGSLPVCECWKQVIKTLVLCFLAPVQGYSSSKVHFKLLFWVCC